MSRDLTPKEQEIVDKSKAKNNKHHAGTKQPAQLNQLKYTHPEYCTYCNQRLDEEGLVELRAKIEEKMKADAEKRDEVKLVNTDLITKKPVYKCTYIPGVLMLPIQNMGLCHFVCPRCKGVMMNEECYQNQAIIREVQASKIIRSNTMPSGSPLVNLN